MPSVSVTRTYLEMLSPADLRAAREPTDAPALQRIEHCPVSFFRYLYTEVGRAYHWTDRLAWTDDQVRAHLADPSVALWLVSSQAAPAGYFELRRHQDRSVEVAYFGLLPEFVGRGWGGHLLTLAVRTAWDLEPDRVWLHTCTLDHPAALPNYLKRGFRPVREEVYTAELPV
ncbi:MAG TPA: GNAT family N-acetyltransferase [Gemmatimonadales bacterium]|nr:GNAT family N-acetyltransferase [Gemmatimonadales bacterium]